MAAGLLAGCGPADDLSTRCRKSGGYMYKVESSCQTFWERTGNQPRFCSDNGPNGPPSDRPCFEWVTHCEYVCIHEGK